MNSLDERLREILQLHKTPPDITHDFSMPPTVRTSDNIEECIAQLKQAFEEAGYVQSSPLKKVQELLTRPDVEKMLAESGYSVDFDKLDELANTPVMTGQEFYQRFARIMNEYDRTELDTKAGPVDFMPIPIVIEAAQRAAGIKEK